MSESLRTEDGLEYRVAKLRQRLADGNLAERGLHIEVRGTAVSVSGAVPSEECREEVLRLVADLLAGVTVFTDLATAQVQAPARAEEL